MEVAIVKYPAGNVASLQYALKRLGVESYLTSNPLELASADKVIFPGQGAAGSAMKGLKEVGLDKVLKELKQPFLGICLGLQLMAESSAENSTDCLGLYPCKIEKFKPTPDLKVPHMAWNKIVKSRDSVLTQGLRDEAWFYFVHSYYMPVFSETIAVCDYVNPFTAMVGHDNYYAVQFHPEKSGQDGELVLRNFLFEA